MKKIICLLLLLSLMSHAQDTLLLKNQTKIISLVLLLGTDSIRYKKITDITGPDLYIRNSEMMSVKYKNGKTENIDSLYRLISKSREETKAFEMEAQKKANSAEEMAKAGALHASIYYNCKGCLAGFFGLAVILGPLGPIPALVALAIKPSKKQLAYPSEDLWKNEQYQKAYMHEVNKIRKRAIGFGATSGSFLSTFSWGLILTR